MNKRNNRQFLLGGGIFEDYVILNSEQGEKIFVVNVNKDLYNYYE